MTIKIHGTEGITFPDSSQQKTSSILRSFRNKIINGDMRISQRGTSFISPLSSAFMLDRWLQVNTTTAAYTIGRQTDAPSGFLNSMRTTITTAKASLAAGDRVVLQQAIEGFNVVDLIGAAFSISFFVRSPKTGTHCVSIQNSGVDRSYVLEYTVNVANAWERKTLTVPAGLITSGAWDWTTGVGLRLYFALAAGSTFQTTPNAWQTGNFHATSSQVNCLDTVGNVFAITGVQLESGTFATEFENRPIGLELSLCQRYYWRYWAPQGPAIGLTNGFFFGVELPVPMRASASVWGNMGASNYIQAGGYTGTQWGLQVIGMTATGSTGSMTVGMNADTRRGGLYGFGSFANTSNYLGSGSDCYLEFSAEL